jgi:hypothetical protein
MEVRVGAAGAGAAGCAAAGRAGAVGAGAGLAGATGCTGMRRPVASTERVLATPAGGRTTGAGWPLSRNERRAGGVAGAGGGDPAAGPHGAVTPEGW